MAMLSVTTFSGVQKWTTGSPFSQYAKSPAAEERNPALGKRRT